MTLHLVDKFIDNGTVHPSGCVAIDRATVLDNHNAFALVSLIIPVVRTTSPRSIKRVARIVSVPKCVAISHRFQITQIIMRKIEINCELMTFYFFDSWIVVNAIF